MSQNTANRREFMTRTGVALAGASTVLGQSSQPVFCVDCQSHIYVPELIAWMEKRTQSPYAYRKDGEVVVVVGEWHRRLRPNHTSIEGKLADMDAAGIHVTALSINDPGPELFGEEGVKVARLVNDFLADVAKAYPERFFPLAFLPLQDMEASLKELDRCVNRLEMKGIFLYSNLDGRFPDEPKFRPLFRRAEEMGLPLLLHPAYPVTYQQTKGHQLTAGLGLMFDTTIALARIILAGILEEHPRLKLVCPHVGGTLPYLIGRLDHQTQVLGRGAEKIRKAPSEYLKQVYLDVVSPLPQAIRYGYDLVGPDRLLYASDHPWVDPRLIRDCLDRLDLPPEDYRKILGENARRLFQL